MLLELQTHDVAPSYPVRRQFLDDCDAGIGGTLLSVRTLESVPIERGPFRTILDAALGRLNIFHDGPSDRLH